MPKQLASPPVLGKTEWILLLVLSVLWGGSFFFSEIILQDLQPFTVVLGRTSLAAIALLLLAYWGGQRLPRSWKLWRSFAVMGLLNNLIPFSLIVWGQTQIGSSLAAILNATTPVFGVMLAHFLTDDERLTANRLWGVLLGLSGVVVLVSPNLQQGLNLQGLGQFAVLGAALSYSFAGLYGRRFKDIPPTVAAGMQIICTAIAMLPVALLLEHPWTASPRLETWGALLGLGLLSTAIAYLLYFRILAVAGATNLMLVTFLIPVSALLLGVVVLGERLEWTAIAGMGLIFLGLAAIDGRLIAQLKRSEKRL
ncbi:DMT family transporter [Phormidium tenue FACHB-886]|nr:DMT family transporter [Phormidium tenue FACHB-886]